MGFEPLAKPLHQQRQFCLRRLRKNAGAKEVSEKALRATDGIRRRGSWQGDSK
jgi:hypothetical protein